MIDRLKLLSDLQGVLKLLEADLLERSGSDDVPEVGEWLRGEFEAAKEAARTAQTFGEWVGDFVTQVAAAWVLSCVFARFLEDNELVDPPRISGVATAAPGQAQSRLQRARDEYEAWFRKRPKETDREYLLDVFAGLGKLPAGRDVFGSHNPMNSLPNWIGPDAAGELLKFFQRIDANSGALIHDFTDPNWDTRFLGDLYQDLSEAARKKYALLQTPEFVEEFILDRTLDPALEEFGLRPGEQVSGVGSREESETGNPKPDIHFKIIDPACGSGHFLLGAFPRILDRWQRKEPGTLVRELVQRTLDSIHGVDINPFAIAIARFRLLLAAMRASGVRRLAEAPAFRMNLVCGDSLYHGKQKQELMAFTDDAHYFQTEDADDLKRILQEGKYHAVVANPPYIVPKDKAANKAYRDLYPNSCHRQYSLAVPFMERIFRLAVGHERSSNGVGQVGKDAGTGRGPMLRAGFTGQITANSFMKREFGKKLIESFFPQYDLTHVIDTSGAYIPGHGTPTVILFGRNRKPVVSTIRTVMGIRGEPSTPADAATGLVWTSIVDQIDQRGSQTEFVSVADSDRQLFHKHPWSIGGGGAAELKELIQESVDRLLGNCIETICSVCLTRADDIYLNPPSVLVRNGIHPSQVVSMVEGDQVRDWGIAGGLEALFPYDTNLDPISYLAAPNVHRFLWQSKEILWKRRELGGDHREMNRTWWEWNRFLRHRYNAPNSITYAEVATHNHFVMDRGGKVFKQTAPVIKLPADASEDDHLALLGLLNSSIACFWMKQGAHNKGDSTDNKGARTTGDVAFNTYAYNGTLMGKFPVVDDRPTIRAKELDKLAQRLHVSGPNTVLLERSVVANSHTPLVDALNSARGEWERVRGEMIFLQEELDWECYRLYGLIDQDLTYHGRPFPLAFGERSFELLLARMIRRGAAPPTTWFERHNATPITEPPKEWPEDYLRLYHRRQEIQQSNPNIALIEQPEYKRRWNTESWDSQVERALRGWLQDRLESYFDFDGRMKGTVDSGELTVDSGGGKSARDDVDGARLGEISLYSVEKLADVAGRDERFNEVAAVYRDDPAFNVLSLVTDLVAGEHVPLLPVLRYKEPGLRKRADWERTWELQRLEDLLRENDEVDLSPFGLTEKQKTAIRKWQADVPNGQRADDRSLDKILAIPVPPKYTGGDFISTGGARYWSLRGKLDVPKERWISFPHAAGQDGTLMLCWAGYDHLQQARAISAHYVNIQEKIGGRDDPRLVPLLACLIELLPWLKQWHNAVDPDFGMAMGDYFEGFINEEARNLPKKSTDAEGQESTSTGWTLEEIRNWTPPSRSTRSAKKKGVKKKGTRKKKAAKGGPKPG